jgi:hypothetical protein
MSEFVRPDFVIAGAPKSATTWLHECLRDHPDVYVPETDTLRYFDMNYHRGPSWYDGFFEDYAGEAVVGEASPTLFWDGRAPARLHETLPDADLLFALRNPIDRAFSQYYHLKSRDDGFQGVFEMVVESPAQYRLFVGPGFYHYQLGRFREYYPDDRIHLFFFDDLVADERSYISDVYETLGVDSDYVPAPIGETVNEARGMPAFAQRLSVWVSANAPEPVVEALRPAYEAVDDFLLTQSEYEEGMDPAVADKLAAQYREDVEALSEYAGRDVTHWLDTEGY